jgi:hypothetical protein
MIKGFRTIIASALYELAYWVGPGEQPWAYVHVRYFGGKFINVTPLSEAFESSQLSEYLETDLDRLEDIGSHLHSGDSIELEAINARGAFLYSREVDILSVPLDLDSDVFADFRVENRSVRYPSSGSMILNFCLKRHALFRVHRHRLRSFWGAEPRARLNAPIDARR